MPQAPARKSRMPKFDRLRRARHARFADYQHRIRAAGLVRSEDDPVPENIDEFRLNLARRIVMYVNDWHGCPQRLCRRQRGCMAPNIACTNAKPRPPASPEESARRIAEVQRLLRDAMQRLDGPDA